MRIFSGGDGDKPAGSGGSDGFRGRLPLPVPPALPRPHEEKNITTHQAATQGKYYSTTYYDMAQYNNYSN